MVIVKGKKKTKQAKIAKKEEPRFCILMTSPNKPRKYVVVADISEAHLVMANAREKDKFVEFTLFEHIVTIEDADNATSSGGLAPAA